MYKSSEDWWDSLPAELKSKYINIYCKHYNLNAETLILNEDILEDLWMCFDETVNSHNLFLDYKY